MAYLYDLTDTWNAAGTVFNAIKMNVTNTASAAGSKIVSLQVGATDKFTVDKDGNGYFSGTLQAVGSISSPNAYISGNSGTIGMQDNSASILAYNGTGSGGITNTLRFITGASERMRITSAGDVGIGTAAPASFLGKLTVIGNISAGTGGKLYQFDSANSSGRYMQALANHVLSIGKYDGSDVEQVRITSAGNVGIGTSSPGYRLTVSGSGDVAQFTNGTRSAYIALDSSGFNMFTGAGQTGNGIYASAASNYTALYTASSERMRITSAGDVGIGTTTPGAKLALSTNTNNGILIDTPMSSTAYAEVRARYTGQDNCQSAIRFYNPNNAYGGALTLWTQPESNGAAMVERMRIDSSGNVGIGTSSPGVKLDVVGAGVFRVDGSGTTTPLILRNNNTASVQAVKLGFDSSGAIKSSINAAVYGNDYMTFNVGSDTERMRIDSSGNVGIGTSSPSSFGGYTSLTVNNGTNGGLIEATTGGTRTIRMQSMSSGAALIGTVTNHDMSFMINGAVKATIDTGGNLGLGGTPSAWSALTGFDINAWGGVYGYTNQVGVIGNAYYNSGWKYKSSNYATYYSQEATGDHRWYTAPSGTAGAAISFTQAMTLHASGGLSVGTASDPGAGNFTLYGSGNSSLTVNGAGGTGSIKLVNGAGTQTISGGVGGANNMTFAVGGTERARIDSSGSLLVGTTTFSYNPTQGVTAAGGSVGAIGVGHASGTASGNGYVNFAYNGSNIGSITQDGTTAVLYNTTSDRRLKENIAPADDAAALIDAIQVRKFDWKADGSHQRYGMVAQELLEVAPEAVSVPADEEQMMGVDYSKLVPMMLKEIQSLRARVAQLEGN